MSRNENLRSISAGLVYYGQVAHECSVSSSLKLGISPARAASARAPRRGRRRTLDDLAEEAGRERSARAQYDTSTVKECGAYLVAMMVGEEDER
jgi:hypothetical protein